MIPINQIIKKFINDNITNKKFLLSYIKTMWKHIVGENVAKESDVYNLKNDTLEINVYEDKLLTVLVKLELDIVKKINDMIGQEFIKHIVFKKSKRNLRTKETQKKKRVKVKQEYESLMESEFIKDDELKELFDRAYKNYRKIIPSSED